MKIGGLTLDNPLILAPMAGITQLPLRLLAKEAGCALVVTEMVSANGLIHRGKKTLELLRSHPAERPLSAQIFGANPEVMAEAAQIVQAQGADLLDINMGCSVRKVVKQGAGAALMAEPDRLEAILKAVRSAVRLPLTIKLRSGWDPSGDQAVKVARMAEDCGVEAVAIHPRTALQGFGGRADWSLIARVKDAVSMPVIGNGDVCTPNDVIKIQQQTGCDGVMIGRAAIGNPWIFSQALDMLHGRPAQMPDLSARLGVTLRYIESSVSHFGEFRAVRMMRSKLAWFVKGLPRASGFRSAIVRLQSFQEMTDAVRTYFEGLQTSTEPFRRYP
ncbi:MAG: tRNA dihydrouridine synthase DusB [Thermodesulfobacteriota bacterium]|nr:tRNA dihydrouridine synthase DusB [Thermodesulfobacteriota bacterium]